MGIYVCLKCGYIYYPERGEYSIGVDPGTPFESLDEDFECPHCSAPKSEFVLG
jgi:rubredoxin